LLEGTADGRSQPIFPLASDSERCRKSAELPQHLTLDKAIAIAPYAELLQ
jgi:hypothetical protein